MPSVTRSVDFSRAKRVCVIFIFSCFVAPGIVFFSVFRSFGTMCREVTCCGWFDFLCEVCFS